MVKDLFTSRFTITLSPLCHAITKHITMSSCCQISMSSSMMVAIPFHSLTDFLAHNKTGFLKRTANDGRSGDGILIAADV
jgi:hypothetical protein